MGRVEVIETDLEFKSLSTRGETDFVVVHHVGDITRDVSAEEIHGWQLNNGWAGIGYHYVIRKDGSIERGRPRTAIGSHCYGSNSVSLGICVVGDFMQEEPNDAQLDSLKNLLADLMDIYMLEPSRETIVGHYEKCETSCPGDNMKSLLDGIASDVSNIVLNG